MAHLLILQLFRAAGQVLAAEGEEVRFGAVLIDHVRLAVKGRFELILASQCRVVYQTVTLSDFHEVHNDTHGVLTTQNVIHIPGFQPDLYSESKYILIRVKPVRCSPDVAPRLTSGGYEDKVDVITPINILFRGGGEF